MANNKNIPCVVFGASGYAGVELAKMIANHPIFTLEALFVSEQSSDANKLLSDLYPKYKGLLDFPLVPGGKVNLEALKSKLSSIDQGLVFLATPHEFSHDIAYELIADNLTVLDLSGGFRLQDPNLYPEYYGFAHQYAAQLSDIPYGLPEWNSHNLKNKPLISLPGCYPTASQMAIKPLVKSELLTDLCMPVINAISGVSGAGRKAALSTSFCELSLKPYNLFVHRHAPEICQEVGRKVIFTPHVADFDRGILATVVMQVKEGTTLEQVNLAFESQYSDKLFVRLRSEAPQINDVAHTAFCDLYWQLNGTDLIVISAIDNVLKGASSQAIQCANIVCDLHEGLGLLPSAQTQGVI